MSLNRYVKAGDLVTYEDAVNPRRTFRVLNVNPDDPWDTYELAEVESGEVRFTGGRGVGWALYDGRGAAHLYRVTFTRTVECVGYVTANTEAEARALAEGDRLGSYRPVEYRPNVVRTIEVADDEGAE